MIYRTIGTAGPHIYTQIEADQLLVDNDAIRVGTQIRISDLDNPLGKVHVFNGNTWEVDVTLINPIDNLIYVAKNGNNETGNGSIGNPYQTISFALTKSLEIDEASTVIISVLPGMYTEDVVVTRPKTVIVGINGASAGTCINGSITFTPSKSLTGGTYASIFSLEDLLITQAINNTKHAINFDGNFQAYIRLRNVKIVSVSSGTNGLNFESTAPEKSNIYFENVDVKTVGKAFHAINVKGFTRGYFAAESTLDQAVFLSASKFTFNAGAVIVSSASADTLELADVSTAFVTSSSLTNDSPINNGASIATVNGGSTLTLSHVDLFSAAEQGAQVHTGFTVTGAGILNHNALTLFGNDHVNSSLTINEIPSVLVTI